MRTLCSMFEVLKENHASRNTLKNAFVHRSGGLLRQMSTIEEALSESTWWLFKSIQRSDFINLNHNSIFPHFWPKS